MYEYESDESETEEWNKPEPVEEEYVRVEWSEVGEGWTADTPMKGEGQALAATTAGQGNGKGGRS